MKKLFLAFSLGFVSLFSYCFATEIQFPNKIKNTNFVNKGYLKYDLNSFNYNKKYDIYSIDVMEELDPGGDLENIKCPYEEGYITHVISSTKYSPKHKIFNAKYKGFMCSIGEYEYENNKPVSFHYNYKGVYYDNNSSIIPDFNMDYFNSLKKEINSPNEYNYFGAIKNLRNLNTYEPVPPELQDKYIKKIPKELLNDYQLDMDKALEHILYDKITYDNKTLEQMLLNFGEESDTIYQKYLKNKHETRQNKVYIERLKEMLGTISLYPDAIIEELQPVINKYNLEIEPGSESDIFLYRYYIEKYNLKYSKKINELLNLKEYTYTKIDVYISEISNVI